MLAETLGLCQRVVMMPGPARPTQFARDPMVPVDQADPEFPLRVHLYSVYWGIYGSTYQGFGSANLTDMGVLHGFDYGFWCEAPFVPNHGDADVYQARWKRPGERMEILMKPAGGTRPELCELKIALKSVPYTEAMARSFQSGTSRYHGQFWQMPDSAYLEPDPDYGEQLHVISSTHWFNRDGAHGSGVGNLLGKDPKGVEYTYDCGDALMQNYQPQEFYEGHWVKPGKKLEVLLQRPGSDKVDKCTLNVEVKPQPYAMDYQPPSGSGTAEHYYVEGKPAFAPARPAGGPPPQ